MTETNWRAEAESGVDVVLAACSLMLGLSSVSTLVAIGYLNYTRLPWFDGWEHWIAYLKSGWSLTFLFSQHNEHRIPVSRVLYLVDQRWFNADTRFLLWCSFLAQFGSALVIYRLASLANSSRALSVASRIYILGLILALTFAASQWINFTWTFQVCFVVVFFAAIAAFAALSGSVRQGHGAGVGISTPWLIIAIVMALIATGSMANGLLVWPLLVLMAACMGLPKGAVGALVATGAAAICAYFYGYRQESVSTFDVLDKTPTIATFALAYLGSLGDEPFMAVTGAIGFDGGPYRVPVAASVGLAGVACFLWLLVATIRHRHANTPSRVALLHCLAFLGASAGLTAVGRVRFPLEDALTTRYATPSLLFWTCLVALVISNSATGPRPIDFSQPRRIRIAALLAAAFAVLPVQSPRVAYASGSERYMREGEYAIINNVYAASAWQRFMGGGSTGRMIPVVSYFREHHLAAFAQDWTGWLGDPVRAHFLLDSNESECQGEWVSASASPESFMPGIIAQGWELRSKIPSRTRSHCFC